MCGCIVAAIVTSWDTRNANEKPIRLKPIHTHQVEYRYSPTVTQSNRLPIIESTSSSYLSTWRRGRNTSGWVPPHSCWSCGEREGEDGGEDGARRRGLTRDSGGPFSSHIYHTSCTNKTTYTCTSKEKNYCNRVDFPQQKRYKGIKFEDVSLSRLKENICVFHLQWCDLGGLYISHLWQTVHSPMGGGS